MDAVGWFLEKELVSLWDSIFPEPGQPSAKLSQITRPTACRKTQHTMSQWYRAVHVPLISRLLRDAQSHPFCTSLYASLILLHIIIFS